MNADALNNTSKTDWARVDAINDEDIDTSDIPPLSDSFFAQAKLQLPSAPVKVTVPIDADTFAWFQSQGENAERQMGAALKIYAEAHKIQFIFAAKSL